MPLCSLGCWSTQKGPEWTPYKQPLDYSLKLHTSLQRQQATDKAIIRTVITVCKSTVFKKDYFREMESCAHKHGATNLSGVAGGVLVS